MSGVCGVNCILGGLLGDLRLQLSGGCELTGPCGVICMCGGPLGELGLQLSGVCGLKGEREKGEGGKGDEEVLEMLKEDLED